MAAAVIPAKANAAAAIVERIMHSFIKEQQWFQVEWAVSPARGQLWRPRINRLGGGTVL
jgi:hypothetical protein